MRRRLRRSALLRRALLLFSSHFYLCVILNDSTLFQFSHNYSLFFKPVFSKYDGYRRRVCELRSSISRVNREA